MYVNLVTEHTAHCSRQAEIRDKQFTELTKRNKDVGFIERHYYEMGRCRNFSSKLFFANGEFFYIEYPSCHQSYESGCDFVVGLLNGLNEKKGTLLNKVVKSNVNTETFRDYRIRGIEMEDYFTEINYLYSDMTGKEYCIKTERPWFDVLNYNDNLRKDFHDMKDYLKKKKNDYLIEQLNYIYNANHIYVSEFELIKTSEHLSKLLTKKIKQS